MEWNGALREESFLASEVVALERGGSDGGRLLTSMTFGVDLLIEK